MKTLICKMNANSKAASAAARFSILSAASIVVAAALASASGANAQTTLIGPTTNNGNFNNGIGTFVPLADPDYAHYQTIGSTGVTDATHASGTPQWTVSSSTSGFAGFVNYGIGAPASGSVELLENAQANTTITSLFSMGYTANTGDTLTLTAYIASTGVAGDVGLTPTLSFGSDTFNLGTATSASAGVWNLETFTFVVPELENGHALSSVSLELFQANGGYAQNYLSNVGLTVTAVPEPSTWAMMLGGLGMLTMFRRRRA
jgi:hypothetical protein